MVPIPALRAGRPPCGPRRGAVPRPGAGRASVPVPARVGWAHAVPGRSLARRARPARWNARRRCRRGVRQGRAAARARLPGRPGPRTAGAGGRSAARAVSARPRGTARAATCRSRASSRRLPGALPSWGSRPTPAAPISRPATRTRSSRRSSSVPDTRSTLSGRDALAVAGGVAANCGAAPRARRSVR